MSEGVQEDARCCGSGTCIIDAEGRCWCGQRWDGEKMATAPLQPRGAPCAEATHSVDPDLESRSQQP